MTITREINGYFATEARALSLRFRTSEPPIQTRAWEPKRMMHNITVYGASGCSHTNRTQTQLRTLRMGYEFVNVEANPMGMEEVRELRKAEDVELPLVVIEGFGTRILSKPDEAQLMMALVETKMVEG